MSQDNDVERLFSWLQTPDIHYREFAGAREVTDATVAYQERTNTPQLNPPAPHHTQLDEEYPQDQFPDQSQVVVEVEPAPPRPAPVPQQHAPVAPAPAPPTSGEAQPPAGAESGRPLTSVFNRLSGGQPARRDPDDRPRNAPGLSPTPGRPR
jgi:hypothetical protein